MSAPRDNISPDELVSWADRLPGKLDRLGEMRDIDTLSDAELVQVAARHPDVALQEARKRESRRVMAECAAASAVNAGEHRDDERERVLAAIEAMGIEMASHEQETFRSCGFETDDDRSDISQTWRDAKEMVQALLVKLRGGQ